MSWPHYELIAPALKTLGQLGEMLPEGWFLKTSFYHDGTLNVRCINMPSYRMVCVEDLPPENGTYTTPDLIRLVQHVRRLEGLDE